MLVAEFLKMLSSVLLISTTAIATTITTNMITSKSLMLHALLLGSIIIGNQIFVATTEEKNIGSVVVVVDKIVSNNEMPQTNYNYSDNSSSSNQILILQPQNNATFRKQHRGKRYLEFPKGSRMSWRTIVKNNMFTSNTLFAYAYGLRTNYQYPDNQNRLRPILKRDLVHDLEGALEGHGFDGRACILKSFCTAIMEVESRLNGGMLLKLLKIIFELSTEDKRQFTYLREENCKQILHSHCPISFDSITPHPYDV